VIEFKKVLPWKDQFLHEDPQTMKLLEILGPKITEVIMTSSDF
jgi:hypothetical protein